MSKYFFLLLSCVFLFTGCSSKLVFEPQTLGSDWDKYEHDKEDIIDTSSNVALLESLKVLTKEGVIDTDIHASSRLISLSDGWIISASIDGNLYLTSQADKTQVQKLVLEKTIAGVSVKGDDIAVLFADNEIALYSLNSKKLLFKETGAKFIASDSRIVNPHFMKGLVLFATLDGKVIIVNSELKKRLRTIIVSSDENFNNIISLNILENKIIAATGHKILAVAQKEIRANYEVRNIAYDKKNIFITTKQGEIVSLTSDLQVVFKEKFPFAHFYGIVSNGDKIYVLEKEGYMIILDKNSFEYTVHEVNIDDGFTFTTDTGFYIDNKKILTE